MDGRDITEDLRSKLDEVPPRHKPRFYKFRVEYKDKKGNTVDNEQTGTAEIMLILSRHPEEGMLIFYLWIRVKILISCPYMSAREDKESSRQNVLKLICGKIRKSVMICGNLRSWLISYLLHGLFSGILWII